MKKSLLDTINLFKSNWKLFLLLTLGTLALIVPLVFLLPSQYRKEVTLSVTPVLSDLQQRLGQEEIGVSSEQVSRTAALFLKTEEFGVTVDPIYDETTGELDVRLLSGDKASLEGVGREMDDFLEAKYQESYEENLGSAVETQVDAMESGLRDNRDYQARLEQQIESPPADPAAPAEVKADRVRNFENLLEDATAAESEIEARKEYFEGALEDLPRLADEPVSVEVADESDAQRIRPSAATVFPALLLGSVLAVAGTLRVRATRSE